MGKIDELKKILEEFKKNKPITIMGHRIEFMEERRKKQIKEIEALINDIETGKKDEIKVFELIEPIIRDVDFSDQAFFNHWQPYQLHPYPWKADHGQLRDAEGNVIGNYPFTLGDELDHSCGRLMARSPELIELMGLTLRTIGDVIRSEPDMRESNREVLDEISDMLREAIQDKPGLNE